MNETEFRDYIVAEGPEGLKKVLDDLYEKSQNDSVFSCADHYVLYQLGNQRSLIKVDLSKKPFKFWYNDLMGRPATNLVKNTVAEFLLRTCGEETVIEEGKAYE